MRPSLTLLGILAMSAAAIPADFPPPDKLPQFGESTPFGRPGQPAELASLYVLLASPESSYCTGQTFGAVGGRGGP